MDLLQFLLENQVTLSVRKYDSASDKVILGHVEHLIPRQDLRGSPSGIIEDMLDNYQSLRIYLACPYSHDSRVIKVNRYRAATQKVGELMRQGYIVYSPITSSHPVVSQCRDMPTGWDYWEKADRTFLEWCDEVWVLCLDGWKESKGVQAEIKIAEELGKKVVYIEP